MTTTSPSDWICELVWWSKPG